MALTLVYGYHRALIGHREPILSIAYRDRDIFAPCSTAFRTRFSKSCCSRLGRQRSVAPPRFQLLGQPSQQSVTGLVARHVGVELKPGPITLALGDRNSPFVSQSDFSDTYHTDSAPTVFRRISRREYFITLVFRNSGSIILDEKSVINPPEVNSDVLRAMLNRV